MDHLSLAAAVGLLLITCAVGLAVRWIRPPYTIILVIVGLVIALFKLVPQVSLTHNVAFFIILPPILFQGGMHLNLHYLKQDWKSIAALAIPGVVITALIVGCSLSFFWRVPLNYALLFGALISATDPVSVLAVMKRTRASERLRTILEAESLFNDGTGVVLFTVIAAMIESRQPIDFGHAVLRFLMIAGGGALVGVFCGFCTGLVLKTTRNHLLHVILTVILAFGSTLMAESLHFSGIIAVVVTGLMMAQTPLSCMSAKSRETVMAFWKAIDLIMNSVIFLMIGIQLQVIGKENMLEFKKPVLIAIAVVLIARLLVVYPAVFVCNRLTKPVIPFKWNHILFWGGLRGTIPIILMVQLPEFQYRTLFLAATFGIVLFSIIIQGITIDPLLKRLNLQSVPVLKKRGRAKK